MMSDYVSALLIFFGSIIVLLAAVGLLRFPDTLTRMAAASTASTLGSALIGLGACFSSELATVRVQSALLTLIFWLALPLSSHLIGRAGLRRKMPVTPATRPNESEEVP